MVWSVLAGEPAGSRARKELSVRYRTRTVSGCVQSIKRASFIPRTRPPPSLAIAAKVVARQEDSTSRLAAGRITHCYVDALLLVCCRRRALVRVTCQSRPWARYRATRASQQQATHPSPRAPTKAELSQLLAGRAGGCGLRLAGLARVFISADETDRVR